MNVYIQLTDVDTGEIISRNSRNLVFDSLNKNDVGFKLCNEWIKSAIRGVRNPHIPHDKLEISFKFYDTFTPDELFVDDSRVKIEKSRVF